MTVVPGLLTDLSVYMLDIPIMQLDFCLAVTAGQLRLGQLLPSG
jgi:hypothetical protein